MTELDRIFARLAGTPADRDLSQLEADVWGRIDAKGENRIFGLVRALPVMATAFALVMGFATAVVSTPPRQDFHDMAVFSAHTPLAPSTLLAKHS